MDAKARGRLMEISGNLMGAAVYIFFAAAAALDVINRGRFSSAVMLALVTVFAFFFIIRRAPREVNPRVYDWIIGLAGTFAPLLLRPAPEMHEIPAMQALQLAGMLLSIYGIVSLNRSIGLIAAHRGVQATGAYKYLRHPIYAGYFISFTAYWAQNITLPNTAALVFWMALEIMRIFAEEKVLSKDPAYAEYARKVRWRMLPFVF